GEVVALVGASGAGKSLLAHAVLGLLPPNAVEGGRVLVDGTEVPPAERRRFAGRDIALLPQSVTYLDPVAPVGSQVRRAARLAGLPQPRAAAGEALRRYGLGPEELDRYSHEPSCGTARRVHVPIALLRCPRALIAHEPTPALQADRPPHELSGGMARCGLVAIALLGDPRVVIAGEPTPGLQADSAEAVLSQLRARADAGCGVLLITHDLVGALAVCDRVVICDAGR